LPGSTVELQSRVSACVVAVSQWLKSNRLQLNATKTEIIWCSSTRRKHQIPTVLLTVGSDYANPVLSVRNLRIYIDSDLTMKTQVSRTVSSCFAMMRQLRSTRRSVTRPVLLSLVMVSLVLTRLDYGSVIPAGLPCTQLDRLQSVFNAAARLVYSSKKYDHITQLLRELHWLRVSERIDFQLAVIVYRCLHGQGLQYLAAELYRASDRNTGSRMRSSSMVSLIVPRTKYPTIGDRAFPLAAGRVWNCLSPTVTSSTSLLTFKKASENQVVHMIILYITRS